MVKQTIGSGMTGRAGRTIYVGNLPLDIRKSEIEDLFYKITAAVVLPNGCDELLNKAHAVYTQLRHVKYGRILEIELKTPARPPGYCFVEFESSRDAEDAVRGRDGYNFDGYHLRVELAHGGRAYSSSSGRSGRYGGGGASKYGVSHRSEYRVVVRGLPSSASWQDLKDYMRKAGDVCFVEVFRDGDGAMGLVDYTNYEDMKYAVRKLDDTEFKNPFTRSYIRVKIHEGNVSKRRSPSRSLSKSRSRSRSPNSPINRRASRSASKSVSPRPRSFTSAGSPRSRSRSRSA